MFDADSGALLARAEVDKDWIEVSANRLVVLSRHEFESPSFGPALPAADPDYRIAWVEAGEVLDFEEGTRLELAALRETSIRIDAVSIGRAGTRPLVTGDGELVIRLDPDIGGHNRIVRARLGDMVKYAPLLLDEKGIGHIKFSSFDFSGDIPPCKAIFEVLAPGAAGDLEARAELSVSTCMWPGLLHDQVPLLELPCPENFVPSHSAGLRRVDGRLEIDLTENVEAPVLGLSMDGHVHEFVLKTGIEVLQHYRHSRGNKILVPRGARVTIGHEERHDSLIVQSSDRDADLLVLGREFRRPFFARQRFEVTPELLEEPSGDDRIALRRKDGRVEILAHVDRRHDPVEFCLDENDESLFLAFLPQQRCDALRVQWEPAVGETRRGDYSLGRHLVDFSPLGGISVGSDVDTGRLWVKVEKSLFPETARLSLWTRQDDQQEFHPLVDGDGIAIAVGLGEPFLQPDTKTLEGLARLAAEPAPARLEEQYSSTIGHAYRDAMRRVGECRLVGSVRSALLATRPGGTPRHDLVGVAPWIFEASVHAFQGLPEECGLAPLARLRDIGPVSRAPDPHGDNPLAQWLTCLGCDDDLPGGLSGESLAHAFAAIRFRIKESDLGLLLGDTHLGMACSCICACWSADVEELRVFDAGGSGGDRIARIAVATERFARACALGRASTFLDDLAFRTGLSPREIGESMTLMLRAGIEFFVYFRALWSHAAQDGKKNP